jgi:LSD1 subclass zinc finger protein
MDDLVVEKLNCKGCGASLEYSAGAQALKCQYCSAITEIERAEDELDDAPDMIVPLTVEKRDLENAVNTFLASGDYTPDDLLEQAVFTKFDRFYAPAYMFEGQFDALWTASFGYDRTEHYTAYETQHSNGRSRQVPVTKTKTVTDWSPVNGADSGDFLVTGYAGSRLPPNVAELVEYSPGIGKLTDFKASFTSGLEIEPFALTDSAVYHDRGDPQVTEIIERSVKSHAQGNRQRDWHWTANISKRAIPVAIPICHVVYEYTGKQYNIWTDGTDSSVQIADALPMDEHRQKKVRLGFIPGVASTVALLLAGMMGHPAGMFEACSKGTLFVVAGAWTYGFWRRHALLDYSLKLRQALLAEKTASRSNMTLNEADGSSLADSFQRPKKPWALDPVKDKRGQIIGSAVSCVLVLVVALAQLRASAPNAEPVAEAPAAAPAAVVTPQPEPAPAPAPEQAAPATDAAATPAAQPDAAQMPAAAPAEEAPAQPPAAAADAATAPAEVRSNATIVAMVNAAAQADWHTVDAKAQALKQAPQPTRGDRKSSRTANAEGLAALEQKDNGRAIAAFTRGVSADTSDVEVRNNLAFAYLQSKNLDQAISACAEALLLAPDRSAAWITLADALGQAGKQAGAIASLRLTVHFSVNRQKTIEYLNRVAQTGSDEKFRAAAAQVAQEAANIP